MRAGGYNLKHFVGFFLGEFFYGEIFVGDYEVAYFYSQQIFKANFRCFIAKINQPEFYLVFIINIFYLSGNGKEHILMSGARQARVVCPNKFLNQISFFFQAFIFGDCAEHFVRVLFYISKVLHGRGDNV